MSKDRSSSQQTEQQLWDYVSGKLSAAESHAEELEHVEDAFWNDAVEGLDGAKDKEQLRKMHLQLQQQIRQQTQHRRQKRKPNFGYSAVIIAILVVLLFLIVGYMLVQATSR